MDQAKRVTEVDREKLIYTLEENREKHIREYEEAMGGYRETLLERMDKATEDAKAKLARRHERLKEKISSMSDQDIEKQCDYFTVVEAVVVEMKVPRSFAKEYDAAIDMAKWDVRQTLELTHAEFTCFVRDQWEWKSEFDAVSTMYNKAAV